MTRYDTPTPLRHGTVGQSERPPALSSLGLFNLAVRGLMEAGIVAGLAYWGFRTGESAATKVMFGVGAPLVGFGIWGAVDFRRAGRVAEWLRLAEELLISGLAAGAWYGAGQHALGWALAVLAAVSHALVYATGDRLLDRTQ